MPAAASAVIGGAAWLAVPWLPGARVPSAGSLEHLFLTLPLVTMPLALELRARLLGGSPHSFDRAIHALQPPAAALLLLSFVLDRGGLAGALAAGWLVLALMAGGGGAGALRKARGGDLERLSLAAAHVFLLAGAVWLLLSRLGLGPRGYPDVKVLLAAVHFHFAGFVLHLLLAATGRLVPRARRWRRALHRAAVTAAAGGLLIIAAGNALASAPLRTAGAAAMGVAGLAMAMESGLVALASPSRPARILLLSSAMCLVGTVVAAGLYAAGEVSESLIGLPQMTRTHGPLAAVGFALCGLAGHLSLRWGPPPTRP